MEEVAIDTSGTTEFTASPLKMVLLGLLGIAMTTGGAVLASGMLEGMRGGASTQLTGYFGAGFFGLCTILIFWRAVTMRGTVITLSPEGIQDVRIAPDTIAWSAIQNVSTWQMRRQKIIILKLDPQTEANLPLSKIARWTREANKKLGADGLYVVPQGINTNYDGLMGAIQAYWQRYGGGEEIETPMAGHDQSAMSPLEALLQRYEEIPVDQTVEEVVAELNRHEFLLPLAEPPGEDGALQMLVAKDNRELSWVYVYEDEAGLAKVVEQGTTYATMPFAEIFAMVDGKPEYGGIMVYAGAHNHMVPVEYFDRARAVGHPES